MNKGKKFIDEAWLITCTFFTWCFKTLSKPLSLFMHFQPNLSSRLKPFIHAEPLPSFQRVRKLRTSIQTGSGKGPIQGEAAKRHHWSLYPWNVVPLWSASFWKRSWGMRFMIHQLIPRLQKTSFCHLILGKNLKNLQIFPLTMLPSYHMSNMSLKDSSWAKLSMVRSFYSKTHGTITHHCSFAASA